MDMPSARLEASELASVLSPKGPSGKRPTGFLPPMPGFPNGVLATRANLRKAIHLSNVMFRRARRKVEYKLNADGTRAKDEDGHDIPLRVLHETKGWQSARIAGR